MSEVPPKDSGAAIDATLPATPTPNTPGISSGRRGVVAPPTYAEGDLVAERYRIVRPIG
jgi:hypothetical protein